MDEIAKQFGFTLSFSARSVVMREPVITRRRRKSRCLAFHRDSLDNVINYELAAVSPQIFKQLVENHDYDDDKTVSTVNDDESFSTTGSGGVSFAAPLVTAVYERPTTSAEEKRELYYTESEYREFKRNYFFRKPDVQIHDRVVTDVWEIPVPEEPSELYYSESDLQG